MVYRNRWNGTTHDAPSLRAHYADLERWSPHGTHREALFGEPLVLLTARERRLHKARTMRIEFAAVPR